MKRFVFGLATCAIALASCSTNDVLEQGSGSNNPNVINFSTTTTRATVNNLDNVKAGFPVYAVTTINTQGGDEVAWLINGFKYMFDVNTWKWDTAEPAGAPQWPESGKFPINFYAYYPADVEDDGEGDCDGFVLDATAVGVLTGEFTINPTAATQIDFLAANSSNIDRIPQGGSVPLAFTHITTKINFGVIAAPGTKSYIQQMNINKVKNTGTYDYVTNNDWTSTDFTETKPAYDYFGTTTGSESSIKLIKPFTGNAEEKPESFYGSSHGNHLMLLPQANTPVWKPVKYSPDYVPSRSVGADDNQGQSEISENPKGLTIYPLKAYIGSVYRMTDGVDGNEKDLVGYTEAKDHPNYEGSDTEAAGYTGPLFVKVGFPLAAGENPVFSWTMGKAYTYNIKLGQEDATGGYILDDRYYDDKGNPTDLTINGKDPGEPVSGGTINFDVTVGAWEDGQGDGNTEGSGQEIQ